MALLARNRRALATQGQIGNQGLAMDSKLVQWGLPSWLAFREHFVFCFNRLAWAHANSS